MISNHILAEVVAIFLAFVIYASIFQECAFAYYASTQYSSDEPFNEYYWGLVTESNKSKLVRKFLRENDLVDLSVDDDELDYIVLLSTQIASLYDSLTPGLVLAMISIESSFREDADSPYGARGLMQILPCYHEDRIMQFVEYGESYSRDLFYNPRLNIATGCDYFNDLFHDANEDLAYALMMYNQGPSSAKRDYKGKGYISEYARTVIATADQIDEVIYK